MKKIILILLVALLSISLSSCGLLFGDDEYIAAQFGSSERAQKISEDLINYINSKDSNSIKRMFSKETLLKDEKIDEEISELLDFFSDGMTEYEIGGCWGSNESYDSWRAELVEETAVIFLPKKGLSTGDENQSIYIYYTFVNKEKPSRVGVNEILLVNRLTNEEIVIGILK